MQRIVMRVKEKQEREMQNQTKTLGWRFVNQMEMLENGKRNIKICPKIVSFGRGGNIVSFG